MKYRLEEIKPYGEDGKKGEQVEAMFDRIAPTYDKLNHVLSLNIDRCWRNRAIRSLVHTHPRRVLDIATGTGDFAMLAYKIWQPDELIGADLSEGMMQIAREKAKAQGYDKLHFEREDSTCLTYPDNCFDTVTVAFGVRNFEQLERGLAEMHRVLTPHGNLMILELSTPRHFPMKQFFSFYSKVIMPFAGRLVSKERKAYHYLPASIAAFPQGEQMQQILLNAGFSHVTFQRLTMGICTLYIATK